MFCSAPIFCKLYFKSFTKWFQHIITAPFGKLFYCINNSNLSICHERHTFLVYFRKNWGHKIKNIWIRWMHMLFLPSASVSISVSVLFELEFYQFIQISMYQHHIPELGLVLIGILTYMFHLLITSVKWFMFSFGAGQIAVYFCFWTAYFVVKKERKCTWQYFLHY